MNFKISVIKKNQILAWMVTIMLGVAGYLNYMNDPSRNFDVEVSGKISEDLGDAVLVDSSNLVSNVDNYMEDIEASTKLMTANEYFAESRIERNNNYAERITDEEKEIFIGDITSKRKIVIGIKNTFCSEDFKLITRCEYKTLSGEKCSVQVEKIMPITEI